MAIAKPRPLTSPNDDAVGGEGVQRTGARSSDKEIRGFSRTEWLRLAGIYGAVAALHAVGWGLFLHFSARYPGLLGLGLAAYLLGLRHAFDADHIAAVDDTIRFMLQKGKRPLGTGFFFSLGHSTIVFALTLAIVLASATVKHALPVLRGYGGVIGAGASGAFLWLVGALNLIVLLGLLKVWKQSRSGHEHTHIEELLAQRGLLNRLFGGWARKFIHHSWQMYPLGLLFGLGFDTASEIGLLAMAATASVGNLPVAAMLSLPILFAAGMTAMDSTDGVLMSRAYAWAFVNPQRKLLYNLGMTCLSVVVALVIGGVELLGVLATLLHLRGGFFHAVASLDLGDLGYLLVALFLIAWGVSYFLWRFRGSGLEAQARTTAHMHAHLHGVTHIHRNYH